MQHAKLGVQSRKTGDALHPLLQCRTATAYDNHGNGQNRRHCGVYDCAAAAAERNAEVVKIVGKLFNGLLFGWTL